MTKVQCLAVARTVDANHRLNTVFAHIAGRTTEGGKMTKTFKGADRFREQMEWEEANKDKFVVKQIECHNGKVTVFYVNKDEEDTDNE